MRYSRLITYDALYYKSTDAAAFFEAWGDIVGGIGSYPVLGNPHYHQVTDLLETINFEQVAETCKTTVATLILLASSPSRVNDLAVAASGESVKLTWAPSPERGVLAYEVVHGPVDDPERHRSTATGPSLVIEGAGAGYTAAVRALNERGMRGWDWARLSW